jgi:hypothetical protein
MGEHDFGEMTTEWFDAGGQGKTETVPVRGVAAPIAAWIAAVGAARPASGGALAPDVRKALLALHEVLAGGRVTFEVSRVGDVARRAELDRLLDAASPWMAERRR